MMSDDQILAVVKAQREGKLIQWSVIGNNDWIDCHTGEALSFSIREYRVVSESRKPREWDVYEISGCITSFEPVFESISTEGGTRKWKTVRVREVI